MRTILALLMGAFCMLIACQTPQTPTEKKVRIDDDGMLVIEGKRTFILGSYHLPKSNQPFRELAESGFNLVHVSADQEQLDQAAAENLYTWISIGTIDPQKPEASRERMQKTVTKFKDHAAMLIWESVDEPAWTWKKSEWRVPPEPFAEGYQFVKSIDPNHVMYMNHAPVNLVSTMQRYNAGTDIVAWDIYPVAPCGLRPMYALFEDGIQGDLLNTTISQVGEYAEKMRRVAGPNRPVFAVLQGFAWEALRQEDRDESMVQYPTYEESRFMAYNAIIHGVNGINYWGMAYTPQPSEFWSNLKKVVAELASLQPILSARKYGLNLILTYHEMGHSLDTGVEVLAKKVDGTLWLLTANADKNPVKVTIAGLGGYKKADVLQEARSVQIENGAMIEEYAPFDVHIYRLGNR
ncbi:hypothetical protein JXJ21_20275 [candidate division KSB1 bacterium]|nr:hypothetical protein [candidate division KSB1 bacterium]